MRNKELILQGVQRANGGIHISGMPPFAYREHTERVGFLTLQIYQRDHTGKISIYSDMSVKDDWTEEKIESLRLDFFLHTFGTGLRSSYELGQTQKELLENKN